MSGEKKQTNMRLARFSLHFARNRMTPCVENVHGNHHTSTYFILSHFPKLSFCSGLVFFFKKTSTCHMFSTLVRIVLRV